MMICIIYSPFNCLANQIHVTLENTEKIQMIDEAVKVKISVECIKGSVYVFPYFYFLYGKNTNKPSVDLDLKIIGPDNQTIPPIFKTIGSSCMPKRTVPCNFWLLTEGGFFGREIRIDSGAYFPYRIIKKGKYKISAKVTFATKKWFEEMLKGGHLRADKDWSTLEKNIDKFADGVYETDEIVIELR